jgi:hypothetical protein
MTNAGLNGAIARPGTWQSGSVLVSPCACMPEPAGVRSKAMDGESGMAVQQRHRRLALQVPASR